jgi:hypothetical protein
MSINHADLAAAVNIEALNYLVQTKVRAQLGQLTKHILLEIANV